MKEWKITVEGNMTLEWNITLWGWKNETLQGNKALEWNITLQWNKILQGSELKKCYCNQLCKHKIFAKFKSYYFSITSSNLSEQIKLGLTLSPAADLWK